MGIGKLTNFPNGIASFGIPLTGSRTGAPRSGNVRWVGNRTSLPAGDGSGTTYPNSTLANILGSSSMTANTGGQINVMEGHSETSATTSFTGLTAGTKIVGFGDGGAKPTFRLTNTAGQIAVSVANVTFENIRFRLEGANGVVKAIVVTGADVQFINCEFEVASGASNKATIALEFGAGADRFVVANCFFRGTATHNVTDCIKVAGVCDQGLIFGNRMVASATAGNGLIHVTAAATNLQILSNMIYNTHTSSTAAIAIDDVASTGIIDDNKCFVEANGTGNTQGVVFAGTTNTTMKCGLNYSCDEKGKSAILSPAAST